jgi:hypothetical protein
VTDQPLPDADIPDTSVVAAALIPGIVHSMACAASCPDVFARGCEVVLSRILWLALTQCWPGFPTIRGFPSRSDEPTIAIVGTGALRSAATGWWRVRGDLKP